MKLMPAARGSQDAGFTKPLGERFALLSTSAGALPALLSQSGGRLELSLAFKLSLGLAFAASPRALAHAVSD